MKIYAEQLAAQLKKTLAPVYLISGDVPLLVQEAGDAVREAARKAGCMERIVMDVDRSFDWQTLLQAGGEVSLFSESRLLELRMPTGKPGAEGSKALLAYLQQVGSDDILLIIAGKIDKAAMSSKWCKAVDKVGGIVQIWPPKLQEMPGWVRGRMQSCGLQPSPDAVSILVDRVEGNLLAANQEIEKLLLLHGPGKVDAELVLRSVVDSSRFDVYNLVDSALQGDVVRTTHILQGLRGEGVEPPVILWALAREIRMLARISSESRMSSFEQLCRQHRVWAARKPLVQTALQRHRLVSWRAMLGRASSLDRMIKGVAVGNLWDELLQLSLMIAGVRTVKVAR